MKTLFYLNGALIQPPANQKELSIQLNFDKDAPTAQVSINKWRFVRDNAGTIQDYIDGGLLGSDTIYGSYGTTAGIFEGLPFRIDLDYMGTVQTIFDGYLDLTDNVEVSCNDITASAKESHKIDWLNETADSIDFQYLYDTTPSLFDNKFIDIPYIINTIPKAGEAFMAAISAFVITQELINQPNIVGNKKNLLFKGYETVNIPFSLGKRKTELTIPEQIFRVILDTFSAVANVYISIVNAAIDALNAVIGVINDLIDALAVIGIDIPFNINAPNHIPPVVLGSLITDRIGMLMLENDFVDVPKMFIINEGAIPRKTDVVETFNAKYVWENYKYIDSFMPINGKHNQYILKQHDKVPFCYDDYEKVKLDNRILTNFGESALVDSLEWDVYNQSADIKYRVNKQYYNNFKAAITNEATGN
ncbi:MAG: hypothetical protein EBU52_00820 [Cytophagia bacterium]|nr:hypothetical protein [Cytophagia bacterium]